jgi:hypothetical protein
MFELLDNGEHVDYFTNLPTAIEEGYRRTPPGQFFEVWELPDGHHHAHGRVFIGSGPLN